MFLKKIDGFIFHFLKKDGELRNWKSFSSEKLEKRFLRGFRKLFIAIKQYVAIVSKYPQEQQDYSFQPDYDCYENLFPRKAFLNIPSEWLQ